MVLANPAYNYIKGTQNTENACIINATYAGRGRGGQLWTVQLNKRNAPRCVSFIRKKKKTAHPVSCRLHPVHSRDDGGSIVSENVTNTYAFWQSFAAERFVSRSSYSQCGLTYVKCSDKGAKKMNFSALGSGFERSPRAGGRPWTLWFIRTFHSELKESRSR